MRRHLVVPLAFAALNIWLTGRSAPGQAVPATDVLTAAEWAQVDEAIDRGLDWLAAQQGRDGSLPTHRYGQPGVTSLYVLAALSRGHLPGEGPHGRQLELAIDYILASQRPNGLLARHAHDGPIERRPMEHLMGVAAAYNHSISALTLSEAYAMTTGEQTKRMQPVIQQALAATLQWQRWPKPRAVDDGGWRYLHPYRGIEADLSIVGWQLMFLRSAKNAGFSVDQQPIDDAVGYVLRTFDNRFGVFVYSIEPGDKRSRGMAGAGILALAHAGQHNRSEAVQSAEWLLRYPLDQYNRVQFPKEKYHYSVFQCCQGMYQMGGRYWQEFFPPIARALIRNQHRDGSWDPDVQSDDGQFGNAYTTALVVLALGAPNQLLPIFQR
jgi:hypothetical protein